MRRLVAALIVLAAGIVAAAGGAGESVVATPSVSVAELGSAMPGSGSPIEVQNTGTSNLSNARLMPMTCSNNVGFQPMVPNPFNAGTMFAIGATCPGTTQFGMRRCPSSIVDSAGTPLASVLGVCETSRTSTASVAPSPVGFGTVMVNSSAPRTVTVSTTPFTGTLFVQTSDLDVFRIDAPAPCSGLSYCDIPVTASGSIDVALSCHPSAAISYTGKLYAVTSTGDRLAAPVMLTCTGTPATSPAIHVTPTPDPFDLGGVEVISGTASGSIAIENVGTGTLVVSSLDIAGAVLDWSYTLGGKCSTLPCSLVTGDVVTLAVTFDPSQLFMRAATMTIHSNDPLHATTTVTLSGTGLGRTFELATPTSTIDFGYVETGQSAQMQLSLVNRGNRTVTDGMVTAMPPGAPFALSPANPITVSPTMPVTLTITCAPTGTGTNTFMTTLTGSAADSLKPDFAVTATCHGTDSPLVATPGSIELGEIASGTPNQMQTITLHNHGASALTLSGPPMLKTPNPSLTLMPPTSLTIAPNDTVTFELDINTATDADLGATIEVSDGTHVIDIPVSGRVTTPAVSAPMTVALGTFCVGEPTTASPIALTSSGTGTVHLGTAPTLTATPSAFTLALRAPVSYPATLAPTDSATVEVAPKVTTKVGDVSDVVVWHTDVAASPDPMTTVSATFLDEGAAVAPGRLEFGQVPIIIVTPDAQPVTLQNCGTTEIAVSATIHHPFAIDSPDFPTMLMPQETTTFTVGFHPTKVGIYADQLTIKPTGAAELHVDLIGTGTTTGSDMIDAGSSDVRNPASFYSCGCRSNDPRAGWPILLVVGLLRRRRS